MGFLCAGSLLVTASPTGAGSDYLLIEATDLPDERSPASAADVGSTSAAVRQDYAKAWARGGRTVRMTFTARRVCSGYTAALTERMDVLKDYPRVQVDVEISHGASVWLVKNARIVSCAADVRGAFVELAWTIEGGEIAAGGE